MSEEVNCGELVSVMMGLGHFRAAHALLPFFGGRMRLCGSRPETPWPEYHLWKKTRHMYYRASRAGQLRLLGPMIKKILNRVEFIEPYYPVKDLSRPTMQVRFLHRLIKQKGLGAHLVEQLIGLNKPVLHTFFATAIALDNLNPSDHNYLLITDSDFNRVWVPLDPASSRLQYLAPCTQVQRRLLSYGVRPEKIHLTGFPLPLSNTGSEAGLEILKNDLFNRLIRLDPSGRFARFHQPSVHHWLARTLKPEPENNPGGITLTFAVGGAGAQVDLIDPMLRSLSKALRKNRMRIFLSAGISRRVFEAMLSGINRLGLTDLLGSRIKIIYSDQPGEYCELFNSSLRETDILWTKPSELSFYSALGIPILLAPSIGPHESLNKRWLREIHAAISPPGPVECCVEWLFDLLQTGRLAETAWDGFLKGRKTGTFRIRSLLETGSMPDFSSPLGF